MAGKKSHPRFARGNYGRSKRSRIKDNWRRPRGIDNKQRIGIRYMPASPRIGYGNARAIKHLHPSGLAELIVRNIAELASAGGRAVRIAAGVGAKKRGAMIAKAKELKLRILNE